MCELHCRVEGQQLYRSALQVIDGTSCDAMLNDICVDGVCQVRCHSGIPNAITSLNTHCISTLCCNS